VCVCACELVLLVCIGMCARVGVFADLDDGVDPNDDDGNKERSTVARNERQEGRR
jgi:hypothetical protein